ncbi:MAG: hypothetical protein NTW42_05280 [Deltaproteobacteria bacterium]|nr:hypothetical protein [Deltaproteobacteria bacterium]
MKNRTKIETLLRNATRHYLCYEHLGAKAIIDLCNTVQEAKGEITEEGIIEIMNEALSESPGFKDPQDLEARIAVNLMKFQHQSQRIIEKVEINSKSYHGSEFPSWSITVKIKEQNEIDEKKSLISGST